jgi:hypothetical protein
VRMRQHRFSSNTSEKVVDCGSNVRPQRTMGQYPEIAPSADRSPTRSVPPVARGRGGSGGSPEVHPAATMDATARSATTRVPLATGRTVPNSPPKRHHPVEVLRSVRPVGSAPRLHLTVER